MRQFFGSRWFFLGALPVAIAACANATSTAPDTVQGTDGLRGIDFHPEILVMESFPVQLAGSVQITNRRERGVRLTFPDDCVALLRAYDHDGTRNAPVWDQRGLPACDADPSFSLNIPAGGTVAVRVPTVSAYDILGDDLPDGTYRLTVHLEPNGQVVEAEAGAVDLAIPR